MAGLPNITVAFRERGMRRIERSDKGTVALIIKDSNLDGLTTLLNVTDIPDNITEENANTIKRTFIGYVNVPKKVLVYGLGADKKLKDALAAFSLEQFNYLALGNDFTDADCKEVSSWIKSEIQDNHSVNAVLPNTKADYENVINVTTKSAKEGDKELTTEELCSRIAGLIVGTPMNISCTYAPLPELTDIERRSKEELDKAVKAGEFVLMHDGEKVKVARGVNSLISTNEIKGEQFQKIKIVEIMNMIKDDIRKTASDNYIGKYSNSYDNKCLLIAAIRGYFLELERGGLLEKGKSEIGINIEANRNYLISKDVDIEGMGLAQIKQADTGSYVYLQASIRILDTIEDIFLDIEI